MLYPLMGVNCPTLQAVAPGGRTSDPAAMHDSSVHDSSAAAGVEHMAQQYVEHAHKEVAVQPLEVEA